MKNSISKLSFVICFFSSAVMTINLANASDYKFKQAKSFGDSRYQLEKDYPSPERRYSRKELDRARRKANSSLWMENFGHRDPIYTSDQYRGRSSNNYLQPSYRNRMDYNQKPRYRYGY